MKLLAIILIVSLLSIPSAYSARPMSTCLRNRSFSHELRNQARQKAYDMDRYNYWDHVNPITGENISFRDKDDYEKMGENLAIGFDSLEEVCQAWKNSPRHYRVLKDRDYKEYGLYAKKADLGKEKGWLVVLILAESI